MTRQYLLPIFCVTVAIGCSEANDRMAPEDGDTTGDESSSSTSTASTTSTTTPSTTASTSTTTSSSTTTSEDESSSGGQDESSTGEVACTGQCVAVPLGWNGPVVIGRATEGDASCEDDAYTDPTITGNIGLQAPAFTCGCNCSVAEQGACSPVSSLHVHDDPQCEDPPQTLGINQGCTNVADQDAGYFRWSIETIGGACEAMPFMFEQPLEYDESLVACATDAVAEGTCDGDDACVVAPTSDAPMCWWQEGDVECPVELRASREVIYTEPAIDTRGCSSCECGEPDVTCDAPGVVLVQANSACDLTDLMPAPLGAPPNGCVQASAVRSVIWQVLGEPDTSCAAAAPAEPTGDAQAQGAVTVCCAG